MFDQGSKSKICAPDAVSALLLLPSQLAGRIHQPSTQCSDQSVPSILEIRNQFTNQSEDQHHVKISQWACVISGMLQGQTPMTTLLMMRRTAARQPTGCPRATKAQHRSLRKFTAAARVLHIWLLERRPSESSCCTFCAWLPWTLAP